MLKKPGVLPWFVVFVVGLVVVALVLVLGLFGRLSAAQKVLDAGSPVVQQDRVVGDRAAITGVAAVPRLLDPVMLASGGGAAEVPKLLAFASQRTGVPQNKILGVLTKKFPHTAALLQAIPLDQVNAEIPRLVKFLAGALKTTPDQVKTALTRNFPHLTQAINNLPAVVSGWDNIPGIEGMTRFDGSPVRSLPQASDYFQHDLVSVLERQGKNFRELAGKGGVGFIPLLLLVIGIVVMVLALIFMVLANRGPLPGKLRRLGWLVVIGVGVLVVALVLVLNLFGRLGGGNDLLKDFKPAFQKQRVEGARAAVDYVEQVTALSDPLVLKSGGATAEVPKLIAFVSAQTGLTKGQVLGALKKSFPHTLALLQAIPLTAVKKELPGVVGLLSAQVMTKAPKLGQAVLALPTVTSAWGNIPGTQNLTRFDGQRVMTIPQAADYFSKDVLPRVEQQRENFNKANDPWPPVNYFPPLLLVVGIVVILYGVVMLRSGAGSAES